MREILFRGRCNEVGKYNGHWIEGHYGEDEGRHEIFFSTKIGIVGYSCEPESIGQYTGLTDKNGKKIFEGDIIKGKFSNYAIWADEAERAFVYGKSYKGGYKNLMSDYLLKSSCPNGIEIIGNIHDNPELLEVEK